MPIASKETFRAIAQLGIQAAEALDHAHAMGVLHRDVKPSNLLIDCRGSLWIADFGLARFRDDSGLTLTGDLIGTLRYMAPEMATGRRVDFDPRSDIYALGRDALRALDPPSRLRRQGSPRAAPADHAG